MNLRKIVSTAAVAVALAAPAAVIPTLANADVMVGQNGICIAVMNGNTIGGWSCEAGAANQNFFSGYGQQRYGGLCMDGATRGQQVRLTACNSSQAQKWGIQSNGQLKNETGLCADFEGGNAGNGTRLLMWECSNVNSPSANQRFLSSAPGLKLGTGITARGAWSNNRPISDRSVIGTGATLIGNDGSTFSVTGGSMVAAGGGNMVAAGGGNMVAAGGGNFGAAGAAAAAAQSNMSGMMNRN